MITIANFKYWLRNVRSNHLHVRSILASNMSSFFSFVKEKTGFSTFSSPDVSTWSVQELQHYLKSYKLSYKAIFDKTELIHKVQKAMTKQFYLDLKQQILVAIVVIITISLIYYTRNKLSNDDRLKRRVKQCFKYSFSYLLIKGLTLIEYLFIIDIILSWIIPSNKKNEWNLINLYFTSYLKLFEISIPLFAMNGNSGNYSNYNNNNYPDYNSSNTSSGGEFWIDLYPMCFLYLLRKIRNWLFLNFNYMFMDNPFTDDHDGNNINFDIAEYDLTELDDDDDDDDDEDGGESYPFAFGDSTETTETVATRAESDTAHDSADAANNDTTTTNVGNNQTECPICFQMFSKRLIEDHVNVCLSRHNIM